MFFFGLQYSLKAVVNSAVVRFHVRVSQSVSYSGVVNVSVLCTSRPFSSINKRKYEHFSSCVRSLSSVFSNRSQCSTNFLKFSLMLLSNDSCFGAAQ